MKLTLIILICFRICSGNWSKTLLKHNKFFFSFLISVHSIHLCAFQWHSFFGESFLTAFFINRVIQAAIWLLVSILDYIFNVFGLDNFPNLQILGYFNYFPLFLFTCFMLLSYFILDYIFKCMIFLEF